MTATNADSNALETTADWLHWCRLCAKSDEENVNVLLKDEAEEKCSREHSVESSNPDKLNLTKAIAKFFGLALSTDIGLSTMICGQCLKLLKSMICFYQRVQKVQQLLQQLHSANQQCLNDVDVQQLKQQFGLLRHEQDDAAVRLQQQLPEVHYLETKPNIIDLEEKLFETDSVTNPLEPQIKIKVEQQNNAQSSIRRNSIDDHLEIAADDSDDANNAAEEFTTRTKEFKKSKNSVALDKKQQNIKTKYKNRYKKLTTKLNLRKKHKSKISSNDKVIKQAVKDIELNIKTEGEEEASNTAGNLHDSTDETIIIFKCTECPRKFLRSQHYRRHMLISHAKEAIMPELECEECERHFTSKFQLKRHMRTHLPMTMKKTFACPYCDTKCTSNTNVQSHIKIVHKNERLFICEECGVAVHTNAALKTHLLTHTDYAPFECEICKKGFKSQNRLKMHMETHDPRKHVCAECGLQLNSRATLNRHLLVHSDKMQHKCDYCGRAFKRAKALKNHLILHTGLKPYSCDFCDRTFANGSNCRTHKKKSHPEELAALEAAGGGKTFTPNIPKLATLKAVTKNADNLAPVVSKQSGCFAFGKKPKPAIVKNEKSSTEKQLKEEVSNGSIVDNLKPTTISLPTIGNIYTHIMQQQVHMENTNTLLPLPKRPVSQASSSCAIVENDNSAQEATKLAHLQQESPTFFNSNLLKQEQTQQQQQTLASAFVQQHEQLKLFAQQQEAHEMNLQNQHDLNSLRSTENQTALHLHEDQSNVAHFYNQLRQNLQGPFV